MKTTSRIPKLLSVIWSFFLIGGFVAFSSCAFQPYFVPNKKSDTEPKTEPVTVPVNEPLLFPGSKSMSLMPSLPSKTPPAPSANQALPKPSDSPPVQLAPGSKSIAPLFKLPPQSNPPAPDQGPK